jgi:hypothetical protein
MALVRDPWFWKRFSKAVHLDEVVKSPAEEKEPTIWSYVNLLESNRVIWSISHLTCVSVAIGLRNNTENGGEASYAAVQCFLS